MKWWGWGEEGSEQPSLPSQAAAMLHDELGLADRYLPPVPIEQVGLPEPAPIPALGGVVGEEYVRQDRLARVRHATPLRSRKRSG